MSTMSIQLQNNVWLVGLPLTSSVLLEYSSEYLNEYSSTRLYRKYFNTSRQWRRRGCTRGSASHGPL